MAASAPSASCAGGSHDCLMVGFLLWISYAAASRNLASSFSTLWPTHRSQHHRRSRPPAPRTAV